MVYAGESVNNVKQRINGFPWGKPRTRHMWNCLQLSGARGVDNGDVKGNPASYEWCNCGLLKNEKKNENV